MESNDYLPGELETYIPMVCFCDIRLRDIGEHIIKYGNYGIAMKREWGELMKLNPITYPHSNSNYTSLIKDIIGQSESNSRLNEYGKALALEAGIILMTLTKSYVGKMFRNGKGYLYNIRFYDEKEWRYIPYCCKPMMLMKNQVSNYDLDLKPYNDFLFNNYQLKFNYEDINYIIVNSKLERTKVIEKYGAIFQVIDWQSYSEDI